MTQIAAPRPDPDPPGHPPAKDAARHLVASFLLRNRDQIRAIARARLSADTRTVYDSEDVFSSVLRRIDNLARQGVLRPANETELWALIHTIARNTALKKTLLIERARILVTEDPRYGYELMERLNRCRDDDEATLLVYRLMLALDDPLDRQVFALYLRGASHRAIASFLGIREDASRKRWVRLRDDLRDRFAKGQFQ